MLGLDCLQGIFIVHNQKTNLRYSILPNMIKSVKIGNVPFLRYYQDFMILQDIEFHKRDALRRVTNFRHRTIHFAASQSFFCANAAVTPLWDPIVNLKKIRTRMVHISICFNLILIQCQLTKMGRSLPDLWGSKWSNNRYIWRGRATKTTFGQTKVRQ